MSCFGCELETRFISLVSRVRTRRKKKLKTWHEKQEDNSKGDICYLEDICGAEQPTTCTVEDELNIDGGKRVLVMFLN